MAVTHKRTPIDMERALQGIVYEKNSSIATRDGSYVMANVFRPETDQPVPALLCASVYGKDLHTQDIFPEIWEDILRQLPQLADRSTLSLHTHETNDPEVWVPYGYACVRLDVPGTGKSPGKIDPLSPAEADAIYDTIEWIAEQSWCNGKVGMTGISYFAMVQWRVAGERPPHLAAIVPWEGMSDYYREFSRHGGIASTFLPAWLPTVVKLQHGNNEVHTDLDDGAPIGGPVALSEQQRRANRIDPSHELRTRELDSPWWRERSADLERITVPMLSAANWGGNALHLRGNVEAFTWAASTDKWLEVHGGNHRDAYYLPEGEQLHKDFFDHFLKGEDNGWDKRARVQLKIRHEGERFVARDENEWPLARTAWTKFHLQPDATLGAAPPTAEAELSYQGLGEGLRFAAEPFAQETEVTGPLAAKLHVSSSTDDLDLFLTVRALRPDGSEVTFHGSSDQAVPLAQGWLRASHRKLDPRRSEPWRPWHSHDELQKLAPGEVYEVDVEIWPTCFVFPAGYRLELIVAGVDFVRPALEHEDVYAGLGQRLSEDAGDGNDRTNIFRGSGAFLHNDIVDRPAEVFGGTNMLHVGPARESYLLVPVIPG